MKNKYTSPEIQVVEFDTAEIMLTISGEQTGVGVGGGTVGNEAPDLTKRFKGEYWEHTWE